MSTYARTTWVNGASGGTPLNATNLNNFEAGLDGLYDLWTAKGGLVVASAASTPIALTVGTNEHVLVADSAQAAGVVWKQIDNDSIAAAAGIAYSKLDLTGSIVAADLALAAPTSYTPTLGATTTPPTLGTGASQSGRFFQLGDLVWFQALVRFGTSGVNGGSGTYQVSYPVAADGQDFPIGSAWILDSDTGNQYVATLDGSSADGIRMRTQTGGLVSNTSPFTFAASDDIRVGGWYVAA